MNLKGLKESEKIRLQMFPSRCPLCGSSNVDPSFDYEHDFIYFHCNNCGKDYFSDDFSECDNCGEIEYDSLMIKDKDGNMYCCHDCYEETQKENENKKIKTN